MISLPRTVDDPPYFLLWRMDDFAPPTLMLAIGFLLNAPFLMAFAGLVIGFFYQRYREGGPEMFVLHAMYWYGAWPQRTGTSLKNLGIGRGSGSFGFSSVRMRAWVRRPFSRRFL